MSKYINILLLSFCCCQSKNKTESVGSPSISHIRNIDANEYYEIKNFVETDSCFQFLFDFVKKIDTKGGDVVIVTNANSIHFDDDLMRYSYDKTEVFDFTRFNSGFNFVSLRPEIRTKKLFL